MFVKEIKCFLHVCILRPFCIPAKVTKLVGLKNGGLVSPTNLITFAGTQNGEYHSPMFTFLRG